MSPAKLNLSPSHPLYRFVAQAVSEPDPHARFIALSEANAVLAQARDDVALLRRTAVKQMSDGGLNMKQIADRLDISYVTVAQLIQRADEENPTDVHSARRIAARMARRASGRRKVEARVERHRKMLQKKMLEENKIIWPDGADPDDF